MSRVERRLWLLAALAWVFFLVLALLEGIF
jgi:hypothetical protein